MSSLGEEGQFSGVAATSLVKDGICSYSFFKEHLEPRTKAHLLAMLLLLTTQ